MGLITNGNRNSFSPFRWGHGNLTTIFNGYGMFRNMSLSGKNRNWNIHGDKDAALPYGNIHPYIWMLPRIGGGMKLSIEAQGSINADLVPTLTGQLDLTGQGTLTAQGALIISMLCSMSGSGTLNANVVGLLNMSIDLDGQGDLDATIGAIANMLINLEGTGDLDSVIAAYGDMEMDITVTGAGLTVDSIATAVWEYLAAQSTNPSTMGGKLNAAGTAGDPWGTILPAAYTGEQAGKIIADLKQLIKQVKALTTAGL